MFIIRLTIISSVFFLLSCNTNCIDYNIDIENQKIQLDYNHLEKELFSSEIQNEAKHNHLIGKYDRLYALFYAQMLNEGNPYSEKAPSRLKDFIEHPSTVEISSSIKDSFLDFSKYKNEINTAFKHFNYYYPDSSLPAITTMYSNFNANDKYSNGISFSFSKSLSFR